MAILPFCMISFMLFSTEARSSMGMSYSALMALGMTAPVWSPFLILMIEPEQIQHDLPSPITNAVTFVIHIY